MGRIEFYTYGIKLSKRDLKEIFIFDRQPSSYPTLIQVNSVAGAWHRRGEFENEIVFSLPSPIPEYKNKLFYYDGTATRSNYVPQLVDPEKCVLDHPC